MASRAMEMLNKIPIVTAFLLILNCGIHAVVFLFSIGLNNYSIRADRVLGGEYYRIISAAYLHGGVMHIFMNMSSLLQLGASLEAQFGSLQFLLLTMWSTILIGIIYVFLSWVAAVGMNDSNQLRSSGVGFSGVLFCYAVIEANHTVELTRSLYGMCNVPAKLMPFILLVLLQIIIPNVSWLGHLSGVIMGLFCISQGMHLFLTSDAFLEYIEQQVPPFNKISKMSSYVRCTNKSMIISSNMGVCSTVGSGVKLVFTHIWNVIAVVLHIVGFPTDRCCAGISAGVSPLINMVMNCFRRGDREERGESLQSMPVAVTPTAPPSSSFNGSGDYAAIGGGGSGGGVDNNGGSRGRTLGGGGGSRGVSSLLNSSNSGGNGGKGSYTPISQEV